ncbi:hypothetical protein FB561_2704 [Kribbella amoyensis]|uniref:Type II toxin-antitoxin system RelE/ParE family toxin n=1 Tax=Kribbella amoyensis TaxID=996641 RepID=A0A561BRQ7_9ACTN|nr:hypothetical protein [Kribbella amoyensis]TWD81588.1 hypothetical protein FB561_2704 [Kribbella amoyensis]
MTPAKRGDQVAPPAQPGHWELRFGSSDAAKGWDELCRQAAANTLRAWEALRADPRPFPQTDRHHRLKGKALSTVNGLEQWQYEVTGGGRVWYVVDEDRRTVWIRHAGTGHPKATD